MTPFHLTIEFEAARKIECKAAKLSALKAVLANCDKLESQIRGGFIGRLQISELDQISRNAGFVRGHIQHLTA